MPYLNTLLVNVGTNFAPEHLQEMFERPRPQMERMEMRFRPYVEQASYYQFLKGEWRGAQRRAGRSALWRDRTPPHIAQQLTPTRRLVL